MRRRLLALLTFCALASIALIAGSARATESKTETQIHLIVMGPGQHLFTRGGHAAIMVAKVKAGWPQGNIVYNFGETNWDDPMLIPNFLRGRLKFFLASTGDLAETVQNYGSLQGRSVYRQRLNITPDKAEEIAARLAKQALPENREYLFHHMNAVCSSMAIDVLDDHLDHEISRQLRPLKGPKTAREYQQWGMSGHFMASLGSDLFMGRLHDHVLDRYTAAAVPEHTTEYLQTVTLPNPAGVGPRVPMVGPPVTLVQRSEPPVTSKSLAMPMLWAALILALLYYGKQALKRLPSDPKLAGKTLLPALLLSGLVGLIIVLFILLSDIREFKENELLLVFPPTDLLLLAPAWRWLKGRSQDKATWLQIYAHVRAAVAAAVVVGQLSGVLYQRPLILVVLGVVLAGVLWGLLSRIPKRSRELVSG